jgi:glycine cleavage system pyridoxal-binding protein P
VFAQQLRSVHGQSELSQQFSNAPYDFARRHIGPNERQTNEMLRTLGLQNLEELINKTVPSAIQFREDMKIPEALRNKRTMLIRSQYRSIRMFSV